MNRNTEQHFGSTPQIDIKRSKFDMSHSVTTSMNCGDIVPLFVDCDILPGDTVQMDMAEIVRMATPIYPIMGNIYFDVYWFFVPNRLVWDHWSEFWGENDDPWTQQTEYEIPQIKPPTGGWTEGTIADYMGLATKVAGETSVTALPFRAYCKIFNDFFRNENTNKCAHIYTDETTRTGNNGDNYVTDCEMGGKPAKAARFHDRFSSCLPQPQKGDPVTLPLGTSAPITGTVSATTTLQGLGNKKVETGTVHRTVFNKAMQLVTNQAIPTSGYPLKIYGNGGSTAEDVRIAGYDGTTPGSSNATIQPSNLWADVTGVTATTVAVPMLTADLSNATAATVAQLRLAFSIQKYLENAGLHGTRYIEYIRGVFGVTSSDARFQRAEYLGGKRFPLNVDQIIQTSSTDATSPQGNTAGFSCTINRDSMFTKSFEEHGTLMCLGVIRVDHQYQQGIHPMWTRKKWLHFYNPFFAHISEQPVFNREIYAQGTSVDNETFGFQEAWSEYRYKPSFVTGYMRSNANGSLDVWHLADKYNALPTLSPEWMAEPKENIDRVIAVTSQITHQFWGDFYFKCYYSRPMPVYSVPGLIDHV